MALNAVHHPVTVYVGKLNDKLNPVHVQGDGSNVQMTFALNKEKHIKKPLRIEIGSNKKYIQATFVCASQHVCIVNAADAKTPCVFDGFLNRANEMQTIPFIVSPLNTLNENHNLNVRKMALAMEQHTVINIFVNEAIVNTNMVDDKWYRRVWFTERTLLARKKNEKENKIENCKIDCHETSLIARITDLNASNVINTDSLIDRQSNAGLWAPVECDTGPLLIEFNLIFMYG